MPRQRHQTHIFTPVFALIIGSAWLGEVIGLNLMLAVVLVGVGIALVNRQPG